MFSTVDTSKICQKIAYNFVFPVPVFKNVPEIISKSFRFLPIFFQSFLIFVPEVSILIDTSHHYPEQLVNTVPTAMWFHKKRKD